MSAEHDALAAWAEILIADARDGVDELKAKGIWPDATVADLWWRELEAREQEAVSLFLVRSVGRWIEQNRPGWIASVADESPANRAERDAALARGRHFLLLDLLGIRGAAPPDVRASTELSP